jgi:hypothetical protein
LVDSSTIADNDGMAEQYLTAFAVLEGAERIRLGGLVLPGRGWHRLAKPMRKEWAMPTLALVWDRPDGDDPDPWPFPARATAAELSAIAAELSAFDPDAAYDSRLLDEDDAEEVVDLLGERLPAWVAAARERGAELLLVRDGGK